MKKIIPLVFCLLAVVAWGQQTVQSKITTAQVYFRGAQITREAKVNLEPGTNLLLFDDLPQTLNSNTIVVESNLPITLLSVKHNINYLKNQEKPKEVIKLEDTLKTLQRTLQLKNAMMQVYKEEESMLLSNKSIGGQNTGVQTDNLKTSTDFFRTRLTDIKVNQHELTLEIQKINEQIQRISNQISGRLSSRTRAVSEIYVSVSAKSVLQANINLSYFVPEANWAPVYDIRATQIEKPIQLALKANIKNNTGENWDNIKLTLSSANPLQSGVKPNLSPWYLYPYVPVSPLREERPVSSAKGKAPGIATAIDSRETEAFETTVSYTTVQQNLTTIEYNITIPYTIPPDGKDYAVDIQEYNLPALYEYQCVPKLDKDAFLIARISGWDEYNLLPGVANLFAEGKYIGNSYIDPSSVKDTLNISLGRDKGITISREMLKDFSSEKFIGANKTIERTYEISVRNRKSNAISIAIEDQIPLSNQKDIQIDIDIKNLAGAEYDETTGMLKWKMSIQPGETKKVKFTYVVKHPKDMILHVW